VRRILEELPESLDETYERVLKEIKKPNQKHTHRLLQCLVVAVRPLRIAELAEVLAVNFEEEGIPKLNPDWRWVGSRSGDHVGMFEFGHHCQWRRRFEGGTILALLCQRVFGVKPACGVEQRRLAVSHSTGACAYYSCAGMPWCPPPIGRSVDRDSIKNFPLAEYAARTLGDACAVRECVVMDLGWDGMSVRCGQTSLCSLALGLRRRSSWSFHDYCAPRET
jgi:hypothetical protein